jgi:proline iminopeptidase
MGRRDSVGGGLVTVLHRMARILAIGLVMLIALVVGFVGLVVAAALTDRPARFLLAGFLVYCAVNTLGLWLATRGLGMRRRTGAVIVGGSTALFVALFALTALRPLGDPHLPPAPVAGQRFWDLPTGSRIAYVRLPAVGAPQPTPLIFVHGGPGTPDMAGDAEYFGQLAGDGYDVYVYDELGTGRSTRLADPRGYTLDRDVADLEAIRREIGAERLVLVGHSYGGVVAAAYTANHGEHVSRLVLSSPGDPAPAAGGASMLNRLTARQKWGVYALTLQPRALLAYLLVQVNPAAAHALVGDTEMDARFDRLYNRTRPALHCRGQPPGPELHGLGGYANQYPQSAARAPHADFRAALSGRAVPTLVIKGRCDYLSWSSAVAYLRALPAVQLAYLRASGHNAYQDESDRYLADVRAFLAGQTPPDLIPMSDRPPDGYEGPS